MLYGRLAATLLLAVTFVGQTECNKIEDFCSCAWDQNIIKCHVQYHYYNTTEPLVKSGVTKGEVVGDFYYTCLLDLGNIRLDVRTCPNSICESKRGKILNKGHNCYNCKKEGPIVNCDVNIRNMESDTFHDTGKCNNPRWYLAFITSHWATLLAKTFSEPFMGQ